ncbi:glutamine amidotransferase subunit PdxT [Candidatus Altiarchaeales archaeon WOR_SM1_SCG]|nr:glutamine amidotransferase subunit PdxT [Candidatus Altiarchaeales archaeon WOR_SM1_SCG]
MKIGVLALQGDVSEHVMLIKKTLNKIKICGSVVEIKNSGQVKGIDALIIPGGESTTIGKLLIKTGIFQEIKKLSNKPVMGTCAGLILIAKDISGGLKEQELLGLMDIKVKRNAFGRQRESFEAKIKSKIGEIPGVFIRAPVIESAGKDVEVLAEYEGKIVMVRQGKILGLAFHPELADDTGVYEYFLGLVGG